MGIYYPNNIAVAGGISYPTKRFLHAQIIPDGYTCVMLTSCHDHIKAPLILGDPEENEVLEKKIVLSNNLLMQFFADNRMIPINCFEEL